MSGKCFCSAVSWYRFCTLNGKCFILSFVLFQQIAPLVHLSTTTWFQCLRKGGGDPSPNCHCVYCTEIEARAEKIVLFDRRPFYEICMSEVMFAKKVSLISSNYKSLRYAAILQRYYNLLSPQILSWGLLRYYLNYSGPGSWKADQR